MTPDEWPAFLTAIAGRMKYAAVPAVNAMALAYQRRLVTRTLVRYTHPPGTCPTPSPPGQPPALVTGTLRRSVVPELAKGGGPVATASVAPHTVYARIQELGGDIYPVRAKLLHWVCNGQDHFARHVRLPARPYMRPTTAAMAADGSLPREAMAAWMTAVWG